MVRAPLKLLVPLRVSVPVPFLVRPAEPEIFALIVLELLSTVILGVVPPRVIVPVVRVMAPEAEPKLIEFAFTDPEIVIVPAARPSEAVPKIRVSEVVLVVVPDIAFVPADEVLQPWVELFVVGAAHVPPAVPKPAVESLVSQ